MLNPDPGGQKNTDPCRDPDPKRNLQSTSSSRTYRTEDVGPGNLVDEESVAEDVQLVAAAAAVSANTRWGHRVFHRHLVKQRRRCNAVPIRVKTKMSINFLCVCEEAIKTEKSERKNLIFLIMFTNLHLKENFIFVKILKLKGLSHDN